MVKQSIDWVPSIPANLANTGRVELDVQSHAGRIHISGINADYFYWFFESRTAKTSSDSTQIPIVIWLNGGPGASSLVGLFLENGPFRFQEKNVVINPFSWNEKVHLMYWDQPVGTGYTTGERYAKDEEEVGDFFYKALIGFFDKHKEYIGSPIYLAGEGYAGKYISFISSQIQKKGLLNLKGIAIGDGWVKPKVQIERQITYGYEMGFLDTNQFHELEDRYVAFCEKLEELESLPSVSVNQWKRVVEYGNSITVDILKCSGNTDTYDVRRWSEISLDTLTRYLNMPSVKESLHVPYSIKWKCSDDSGPVYENLISDNMIDVPNTLFTELLKKYKILFYSGNFDMSTAYTGTEIMLKHLNYEKVWLNQQRKVWGYKNGLTKGYYKSYKNLTQVIIPGSGHMVLTDKPEVSREMLYNWIFSEKFPCYYPMAKKEMEEVLSNI